MTLILLLACTSVADAQLLRMLRPRANQSAPSSRASTGRYCNSPYCAMCNRIFGPMPGYAIQNGRVVKIGSTVKPATPQEANEYTPQDVVDFMLLVAALKPSDTLFDPGCGDGRFCITAAKRYGCRAVGIEIDPKVAKAAEQNAVDAGVANRVLIITGDARQIRFDTATVVVMYQTPKLMAELHPSWQNARLVLSYCHELPGVESSPVTVPIGGVDRTIYFWIRER